MIPGFVSFGCSMVMKMRMHGLRCLGRVDPEDSSIEATALSERIDPRFLTLGHCPRKSYIRTISMFATGSIGHFGLTRSRHTGVHDL